MFWSIKFSGLVLDKLKLRDIRASRLSTYDFSTLYTTLPNNLIKDKLTGSNEVFFEERTLLTWHAMIDKPSLLQTQI